MNTSSTYGKKIPILIYGNECHDEMTTFFRRTWIEPVVLSACYLRLPACACLPAPACLRSSCLRSCCLPAIQLSCCLPAVQLPAACLRSSYPAACLRSSYPAARLPPMKLSCRLSSSLPSCLWNVIICNRIKYLRRHFMDIFITFFNIVICKHRDWLKTALNYKVSNISDSTKLFISILSRIYSGLGFSLIIPINISQVF